MFLRSRPYSYLVHAISQRKPVADIENGCVALKEMMNVADEALIAIDGGGTNTRVLIFDAACNVLAFCTGKGCNPEYLPVEQCVDNAVQAIATALRQAGLSGSDVGGLVAGIAGMDAPGDAGWTSQICRSLGLREPGEFVGDDAIAQIGAFAGRPGIVYIAGTGSIVVGTTARGTRHCNYDFNHYASANAGSLVYAAFIRIAAGETTDHDAPWLDEFLAALSIETVTELRTALVEDLLEGPLGRYAPLVTKGAAAGYPLPMAVCDAAASQLVQAIRLLIPEFTTRPIPIAPAGGVAGSPYMKRAVQRLLADNSDAEWREPWFPPVIGAAMLALRSAGVESTPDQLKALAAKL